MIVTVCVCVCVCFGSSRLARALERWEHSSLALRLATLSRPRVCLTSTLTDMTWKQCCICQWWRRSDGPADCCGCSRRSRSNHQSGGNTTRDSHQCRHFSVAHWGTLAKVSAQDPRHVGIEKICAMCHSRSFSNKTTSLAGAYTLLPCQWPPLGVPNQVLQMHETTTTGPPLAASPSVAAPPVDKGTTQDIPMQSATASGSGRGDSTAKQFSSSQLRSEIARLERSLQEHACAPEGSRL